MARIDVPSSWESLRVATMKGVILVVGATDTGKTTLARYLYRRLRDHHKRVAFVDGDMGQATLGPPTTVTMAVSEGGDDGFPPDGRRYRAFIGDISPTGHMLPTVVGAHKLVERARGAGATAIVVDTTGLVAASQGGGALKLALVDLLRPEVVIGLQRGSELEHLLVPLRCSRRTRVIDREVPQAVERRGPKMRRAHRAAQYCRAFEEARPLTMRWVGRAVFPAPSFSQHRLVALEDGEGFVLGLGIVTDYDPDGGTVTLLTPIASLEDVDAIRVGDVAVHPRTFRDERL